MIFCVDVKCPDGHVSEVFIDSKASSTNCPQPGCNLVAERIVSPVRSKLDVTSGDYPGATMKWNRQRKERMARERKAIERHGEGAEWDISRPKDFIR